MNHCPENENGFENSGAALKVQKQDVNRQIKATGRANSGVENVTAVGNDANNESALDAVRIWLMNISTITNIHIITYEASEPSRLAEGDLGAVARIAARGDSVERGEPEFLPRGGVVPRTQAPRNGATMDKRHHGRPGGAAPGLSTRLRPAEDRRS